MADSGADELRALADEIERIGANALAHRTVTALRSAAAREEALQEEVMAHQVGDGYQKGYEHGLWTALRYKQQRDAALAREKALRRVVRRCESTLAGLKADRPSAHTDAAWANLLATLDSCRAALGSTEGTTPDE